MAGAGNSGTRFACIAWHGGRGGEGCSFPAVPKFRRRPKSTIPLHSKCKKDKLSFWRHSFSTNRTHTIILSILCTTRLGELHIVWVANISGQNANCVNLWQNNRRLIVLSINRTYSATKNKRNKSVLLGLSTKLQLIGTDYHKKLKIWQNILYFLCFMS